MENDFVKPSLVEPGVKYFLYESLKKCNEYRTTYHNQLFNLAVLGGFIVIVVVILIYKYKGKLTENEKHARDNDKKQYILSKIKNFQDAKRTAQQQLITSLPHWENEHEILTGGYR